MSSIPTREIDGDVAIGRHVSIGGKGIVRSNLTVGHNLTVEGWLEAPNIKGAAKGLFKDEAQLTENYPEPDEGWWALVAVDASETSDHLGQLYIATGGKWVAQTDSSGKPILKGNPTMDAQKYREEVDALEERIETLAVELDDVVEFDDVALGVTVVNEKCNKKSSDEGCSVVANVIVTGQIMFALKYTADSTTTYYADWLDGDLFGTATSIGRRPVAGRLYINKAANTCYRADAVNGTLAIVGSNLQIGTGASKAFSGSRGVALEKKMTTAEGNIKTLQSDVKTAQESADVAQETADTNTGLLNKLEVWESKADASAVTISTRSPQSETAAHSVTLAAATAGTAGVMSAQSVKDISDLKSGLQSTDENVSGLQDDMTAAQADIESNTEGLAAFGDVVNIDNSVIVDKPFVQYVDLKLPSGTLWAHQNFVDESGDSLCYQWGDTEGYSTETYEGNKDYSWGDYKFCQGTNKTLTKYCDNSDYGTVDGITAIEKADDVALQTAGAYNLPTYEQAGELLTYTNIYLIKKDGTEVLGTYLATSGGMVYFGNGIDQNDIKQWEVRSKTDANAKLVIPTSGGIYNGGKYYVGTDGGFWLNKVNSGLPDRAYVLYFNNMACVRTVLERCYGLPVRGVAKNIPVSLPTNGGTLATETEITSLQTDVAALQGTASEQGAAITALQTAQKSTEGDVTALQGRMTTAEGNISTLQGGVGTLQTDVKAAQTDIGALQTGQSEQGRTLETLGTEYAATKSDVEHLNETMGPYSERESITLTPTTTGYVIDASGAKVAKAGWAMSEFTAEKGNVYLFKPGATDGNVSVFAEAITSVETRAVDYTYTYNDDGTIATAAATYNGKTHSYTYAYDASGNVTITETGVGVVSDLPMTYTTTVGSYSPLVRLNADAELPKDGYCRYMSHFKGNSALKVVVSYKVDSVDLTMKVTRDGVLASISTQLGNLSQKEDETRGMLEKMNESYVIVKSSKDTTANVDGKTVDIPARTKVKLTPMKTLSFFKNWIDNPLCFCDASHLDTSKFTTLNNMFACSKSHLGTLDVSAWDVGAVTNMQSTFQNCSSLTSLDVSAWDTSAVTNMQSTFNWCSSLTSLDVSAWDTKNVTNMSGIFNGCSSLTSLDVSAWDTKSFTQIGSIFFGCAKLSKIDVTKWDTSKVTNMYCAFNMYPYANTVLKSLDLSSWSTESLTEPLGTESGVYQWFSGLNALTEVIFGEKWGMNQKDIPLDLRRLGEKQSYKLTDATWASMLTMYDRKSAGLADMTIKLSTKHNVPSGWEEAMTARGYIITKS